MGFFYWQSPLSWNDILLLIYEILSLCSDSAPFILQDNSTADTSAVLLVGGAVCGTIPKTKRIFGL